MNTAGQGDSTNFFTDVDPWLSEPNIDAPISPPTNVFKQVSGNDVTLVWDANLESDLAGYKIHYGDYTGYSYETNIDVGNVTSYTLTGVNISTDISVTAYDNDIDGTNDQTEGHQSWFTLSVELPYITSVVNSSDNSTVFVTFNENVYNTNNGNGMLEISDFNLSLSGGSANLASNVPTSISFNGSFYTLGISISGVSNGTEILTVDLVENSVFDIDGNIALSNISSANNTVVLNDISPPTVVLVAEGENNSVIQNGYTTNNESLYLFFRCSEPTSDFTSDDILVSGGIISSFSGSDSIYTAILTPSSDGLVTLDIAEGAFEDAAGNGNSDFDQFEWTYDGTSPVITNVSLASDNNTLTITFSEPIYGSINNDDVDISDFSLSILGGTASLSSSLPNSISSNSSNVYTLGLSLSGVPNGSEVLTINTAENSIYDSAGNSASDSQSDNEVLLNNESNFLQIDDGAVVAGDTAWITLSMMNADEVVSFQVDLVYPSNISYADVINTSDRANDHITYATMINGTLRIISYSPTLSPFEGNSGTLVTLGFTTDLPYDTLEIEMVDPILGDMSSDNILTSYDNGSLIIASAEPQLLPFSEITINEDESYLLPLDSLESYVFDANTSFEDLQWLFLTNRVNVNLDNSLDQPSYVFTPESEWSGLDTVLIIASDGIYSDTTIIPFLVLEINDPPTSFSLISPPNGSTIDSLTINFTWSESFDIDSDLLQSVMVLI